MRTIKDSQTLKRFPKLQIILETGVVFFMETSYSGTVVFVGDSEFTNAEYVKDIDDTPLVDFNGIITLSNH